MAHHENPNTARKGAILDELLRKDAQLPANCFSLTRFDGLSEGFTLTLNRPRPNGYGVCQPHLQVGHEHIDRNKHPKLGCLYDGRSGLVRHADLFTVNPTDGKKAFYVLNRTNESSGDLLLHVFFGWKDSWALKLKADLRKKEIARGVASTTAEILFHSGDEAFIRFAEDGQGAHVMYPDGHVDRVYRDGGFLVFDDSLTHADMAQVRVENARRQLARTNDRRHHDAQLWKTISLLELARSDASVRDVLLEFLHTQKLSKSMADAIVRARTQAVDLSLLAKNQCFRISRNGIPIAA